MCKRPLQRRATVGAARFAAAEARSCFDRKGRTSRWRAAKLGTSATAVVSSLPVAFVPCMSLPISNLVQTAVLSSTVITLPMDFLHRTFGQAEMTALAGRSCVIQVP